MAIALLVLWFVCGLGAAVFASVAASSRIAVAAAGLAFAGGAWWIRQPFAPTTAEVGIAAALAAIGLLTHARRSYSAAAAGALAGLWSGLLQLQGMPFIASLAASAAVPAVAAQLRVHRPTFAPPRLCEEALLFVVGIGVTSAALPGVVDGWHAAVNLSVQGGAPEHVGTTGMPWWTLMLASGALLAGGFFSLWSRR